MAATSKCSCCCSSSLSGSSLGVQRPRPAPSCRPVQPRNQPVQPRRRPVVQASLDGLDGGAGAAGLAVQAAAWVGVALYAARVLLPKTQAEEEGPPQRECETCGGSGYVACWCSRWSDGDRGCSTCAGSGRMVCNSCRGGGTAVPIEARIYVDNQRPGGFGGEHRDLSAR